jgi:DNA-binding IclR family transcriptional regulator
MPDNTPEEGSKSTLSSVTKAFNILERLKEMGPAGISELATQTEMPKGTVHIHLQTLRSAGFVVKDDTDYMLSYRFLEYGGELRNHSKLYQVARPQIDKLASKTDEVASLGIEESGLRILAYKSEGPESIHDNAPVGEYTNMHWTALGKAMLAYYPEEEVDAIIDAHGLPRANKYTITDRDELFNELQETRERHYSVEDEDRRRGVLTIGAPILERSTDEAIGAVSVSGPKSRVNEPDKFDELVAAVKKAANVIELDYSHY